jgi:hypothetical protein
VQAGTTHSYAAWSLNHAQVRAERMRLNVVRRVCCLGSLIMESFFDADIRSYEGLQQTQRNSIREHGDRQDVQLERNNPHQNERHKPTDERRLYQIELS